MSPVAIGDNAVPTGGSIVNTIPRRAWDFNRIPLLAMWFRHTSETLATIDYCMVAQGGWPYCKYFNINVNINLCFFWLFLCSASWCKSQNHISRRSGCKSLSTSAQQGNECVHMSIGACTCCSINKYLKWCILAALFLIRIRTASLQVALHSAFMSPVSRHLIYNTS